MDFLIGRGLTDETIRISAQRGPDMKDDDTCAVRLYRSTCRCVFVRM